MIARRGGGGGPRRHPSALEAAVRLLAERALTAREIGDRLARRGHDRTEIDRALASLLSRGYLDDARLAYNVASSLAARRLFGRARIAAELRRRGVAPDAVAAALERTFAELDEDALASRAAAGLRRSSPGTEEERARVARALLRRGFSRGAVLKALRDSAPMPFSGEGGGALDGLLSAEAGCEEFGPEHDDDQL